MVRILTGRFLFGADILLFADYARVKAGFPRDRLKDLAIEDQAVAFVEYAMAADPQKRPDAGTAGRHGWITGVKPTSPAKTIELAQDAGTARRPGRTTKTTTPYSDKKIKMSQHAEIARGPGGTTGVKATSSDKPAETAQHAGTARRLAGTTGVKTTLPAMKIEPLQEALKVSLIRSATIRRRVGAMTAFSYDATRLAIATESSLELWMSRQGIE